MILQIFLVILSLCLILLIPHALIYLTVYHVFKLASIQAKWILFINLCFLAIQLPLTVVIMRLTRITWLNGLIYLGSVWYGFFIYLLMAITIAWLAFGLGQWFHWSINKPLLLISLVVVAMVVSGVGLINGTQVKVKPLVITLNSLPNYWQGKKVLHLSDVHLGPIKNTKFLDKLVATVDDLDPDLILITGDLFDGMNGSLSHFLPGLSHLKAKEGVYFATGNHEGYLGLKEPLGIIGQAGITILDFEIANLNGLQIIGIPFPEHNQENRTASLFAEDGPYDPKLPSILLYHTPTNIFEAQKKDRGDQQMKTYWAPDTQMDSAKMHGIDLQLSGHTHKGQLWPFDLLTRRIFKKLDYGLNQDGDFQIYTSSGTGTWGPPMRLASDSEIVVITLQ